MKRLILLISLCFALCANAQNEELRDVLTYMKRAMMFTQALPQEKVYLHFDNTGYFQGETIWFKAYVTRADYDVPTNKSKVLYVELVNPSGDVIEKRMLQLQGGTAYGDIQLDSIYTTGFYEVRAYTRYMTNWGNGGIFSRVFPIFKAPAQDGDYSKMQMDQFSHVKRLPNLRTTEEAAEPTKDKGLRLHFYPEGGKLVRGLRSRVAFVVTDRQGLPLDLGGALLNSDREVLDAVNTQRDGRGVLEFTPDGSRYYLRLADSRGKQHDFPLPVAEDEGITMSLNTLDDAELTATVRSSSALQGRLLGYTLMHNGRVLKADTMQVEPLMQLSFERAKMPAGVSQLTLFTSDGHIQAERLFFICPASDDQDTIRITSPTAFPKPCRKVTVNIKAQPNSNLSFSAIDAATMVNGREGNAQTYMLLGSELKGYIADPGYYFEADDRQHRMASDLLMMVQGWHRYDWHMMASDDQDGNPFNQPVEDRLYAFGRLHQRSKKYPVKDVWMKVHLYNTSGEHLSGEAKTDSLGNYAFQLPDMTGDWRMLINTGIADKNGYWKDVNYYVGIDRNFSPARRMLSPLETQSLPLLRPNLFNDERTRIAREEDHEYIPINKKEHVLPTVVVKARRKSLFENARAAWASEGFGQHYASLYYNADDDADQYADRGMPLPTIYQWLARRNPFFGGTELDAVLDDFQATPDYAAETADIFSNMANTEQSVAEDNSELSSALQSDVNDMEKNTSEESTDETTPIRIYEDGMGYKNRPIVWLIDNDFFCISNKRSGRAFSTIEVLRRCIIDMPIFLDEIKCAYISEDPSAFKHALFCPDLVGMHPVTVFLYRHFSMLNPSKGVRTTHFRGYNVPSTFETEDYSVLPPIEDFRRTLFWAPDVQTDAQGNATVEFFNNSSCREMHISCEGMTPRGKMLFNE